eukprot:jgi/Tetstr1/464130/TSEL_008935.t1
MAAPVSALLRDAIASSTSAAGARDAVGDIASSRTGGGLRDDVAVACAGASCLRRDDQSGLLQVCEGSACEPLVGASAVRCAAPGQAWSAAEQRCVPVGSPCDPPPGHRDAATHAFVFDASGNCLATTECKTGLIKHPEDQRCVTDCGHQRIFSYVMNSCVGVGAPCGDGEADGFVQAFDERGRCAPTDQCAPGHMRHPRDASRCVRVCAGNTRFSSVLDACVSEGDPCPGGAHDRAGVCRPDASPCDATEFPDPDAPGYRTSPHTSAQLNGAELAYRGGVCRPSGVCPGPPDSMSYSWQRGGCIAADAAIRCPPGFTRTSDTQCQMSRGVGGEGRGSVTVSGVDPSHRIRAVYRFRKQPRYRDADYRVWGDIQGGTRRTTGRHTTTGAWRSGKSSYVYNWRNNDGVGEFTWTVEKP